VFQHQRLLKTISPEHTAAEGKSKQRIWEKECTK